MFQSHYRTRAFEAQARFNQILIVLFKITNRNIIQMLFIGLKFVKKSKRYENCSFDR